MPSSRRLKFTSLITLLTICIVFYVTRGARNTQHSQFYTRTAAKIQENQATNVRDEIIAEEKRRLDRVDRIEKEHEAAVSAAEAAAERKPVNDGSQGSKQKPIIPNGEYGAAKVADAKSGEKSIAGRKYIKDGKVVTYKAGEDTEKDDGVAKVGNVEPHSSHRATHGGEYDKAVEAALDDILRKSPIIIFSKTYCPHSKNAKHILIDLYNLTPPPYVVELNEHELGTGLQSALEKLTGRRTVPNIMINGKSIGGGDEVQDLHDDDELASTISSMVGKRMTKIEKVKLEEKKEMRFKS